MRKKHERKEHERVFIVVDGSNLYHRLKEIHGLVGHILDFQYGSFVHWLAGKRTVQQKKYYIGIIRAKPNDTVGQTLRKNQQKLLSKLRGDKWQIARGYILHSGDAFHEKGVDVQIAVDLLIGAYENLYDTVILISSDTDLLPALQKVRQMKKKVEYIGFSHKPSYGLITHSDIRRLLTKEDIEQFIPGEVA